MIPPCRRRKRISSARSSQRSRTSARTLSFSLFRTSFDIPSLCRRFKLENELNEAKPKMAVGRSLSFLVCALGLINPLFGLTSQAIADFENQIEKLKKLALLACVLALSLLSNSSLTSLPRSLPTTHSQADAQKVLQQKEIILEREATIIEVRSLSTAHALSLSNRRIFLSCMVEQTQQLLAAIQKENEALSKANACVSLHPLWGA